MDDKALLSLVLPLGGLVLAASCTFIDVGIDGTGGGVAATQSSSGSTNGSVSTNGTTAMSSSAEATATTGMAGSVAATTSSGMTCMDCLESANCDCDHDNVERYDPDHGCMNLAERDADCHDCNDLVHPGQANWYTLGIDGGTSFDYNCSGDISFQYYDTQCEPAVGGLLGCVTDTIKTNAVLECGGQVATQQCGTDCGGLLQCCPVGNPTTVPDGNGCH